MDYITAKEASEKWGVSERMVRKYCSQKRIPRARLEDGFWYIPKNAKKPKREKKGEVELTQLAKKIIYQKSKNNHFGIYEYIQVNFAYSSNRMASNRLTREQILDIYRTDKVSVSFEPMRVDDQIETINHFACMHYIADNIAAPLSQSMIKHLHELLFYGTFADREKTVRLGEFRTASCRIGINPGFIQQELAILIQEYEEDKITALEQILDFHVRFEEIHPFDDGNGRVGRLIMMKECLRFGIDPFIIDDKRRSTYHRGIISWDSDPSILLSAVLAAQARFQKQMEVCRLMQYCKP